MGIQNITITKAAASGPAARADPEALGLASEPAASGLASAADLAVASGPAATSRRASGRAGDVGRAEGTSGQ
jgi:hypothetical protein